MFAVPISDAVFFKDVSFLSVDVVCRKRPVPTGERKLEDWLRH